MLRVTNQSQSTQIIDNLQQAYQRVAQAQKQVSSGRRINQLSDDPIGATRSLALRNVEASLTQYQTNINTAQPFLQQADTVLSDVTDALNRARELALQLANDTYSPADRQAAASEVQQLQQQVLSLSNTMVGNRTLFGGYLNGSPAFTQGSAGVDYVGDNGQIQVQTSATNNLPINLIGSQVFQGAGSPGAVGVFDVLRDLQSLLQGSGTTNTLKLAVNLDSATASGSGFSPTNAVGSEATPATLTGEANFSTTLTAYDSKGTAHDLTFLFAKTGATTYAYRVEANSDEITGGTPGDFYQVAPEGTLQFNADGTLNAGASTLTDITLTGLKSGAADITISAPNLSFTGSSQIANSSAVLNQSLVNASGIQAQIGALSAALDQISGARSVVGARLNSAQAANDAATVMRDQNTAQRSNIEDADAIAAYSDFTRYQQAFQAALQSAAQVIQPTLLDFLK
jgi:flagellar hook-associated protein 3 FlgL